MSSFDMIVDGALSSCFAVVFSNPFDTMRTRLQLQGELRRAGQYPVVYRSLFQGMLRVVREEGPLALQKGLLSSMLWQTTQNGVRIGLYPAVKADLGYLFGREDSLAACVAAGGVCGFLGAGLASPFMLVKTRLQSQYAGRAMAAGVSVGQQYDYKGVRDALRKIYRANGVVGLWQGSSISVFVGVLASMLQLTTYDRLKGYFCERMGWGSADVRVHAASSVVSTCILVLCFNPLFVISTRVYNNSRKGVGGGVLSLLPTIVKTYRVEGIRGLYKGSTAYTMRSVPHFLFTFVALEQIRAFRENHTNCSYTSGTNANKDIGYFKRRYAATQPSSQEV